MVYGLMTTFAYGIYSVLTDTIKIQQTTNIDTKLAALGEGNASNQFLEFFFA